MIAMESEDTAQIMDAVKETINACTFNTLNVSKLPTFDLEYVFLKIRSKAVGEVSKVNIKCVKCNKPNLVEIDLESVKVDTSKMPSNKIKLTDTVGVIMTWPKVDDIVALADKTTEERTAATYDVLINCIESIFDEKKIYPASESSKEELTTFVESLNRSQFDKLQNYIAQMPVLEHSVQFPCEHCKEANTVNIRGLKNFF